MSARSTNMRTPLGRVRGYGSAKSGTDDFIRQRLTAIANIPLTIGAILIVLSLVGRNHAAASQILGSTPVAIVMLLFVISVFYHMRIGMQAIIEDYVHGERAKYALLILNTFYAFAAGFAAVYAILKLSFGV
jgi:succinate dehydrogenase / fumarate reductase, membrane anchor subunit